MGKYTAISEMSRAILRILRRELVPDTIQNPDAIGLCSPDDRGDFVVGIHLYDIKTSEEIRANSMVPQGTGSSRYPSCFVNLFYMITVHSIGDIKFRSEEEQKVLGKIVQALHDNSCLDAQTLEPVSVRKPMDVVIQMQTLELEEKVRIYNVPNAGYKLSLFYKAAPVEIESLKTKQVSRVTDMEFTVEQQRGGADL